MVLNRKQFIKQLTASAGMALFTPWQSLWASDGDPLQELILKIGNTNDEKERARLLSAALKEDRYDGVDRDVIEMLFAISDRWANGREKYAQPGVDSSESNSYLCGFLGNTKIDSYYFPKVEGMSPFFPLLAFYRARMLAANMIQHGGILMVPEIRQQYIDESQRLFQVAGEAFPENKLTSYYVGNLASREKGNYDHPGVPGWANLQRSALEKLTYLVHWWIDQRQISDGQFGGGWGDDVEMWRSWIPVLFAFEDEKAISSQEKLFEGLYAIPRMERGYTTHFSDVEHTSEEYADPLTCMLNIQPDNPIWEERASMVLDYIEGVWTGENQQGQLQFKSTWFSVDRIDMDEKRACDSPYHTRLVQPLMLVRLRTGNARIGTFLKRWLRTWLLATFEEAGGKPYGIVPAAIHWPDGRPYGTGKNWWQPENYHTPLYDYPSQQSAMYECFLQAYHMTQDESYLKPIRFIAELRLKGIGDGAAEGFATGSLEWCLAKMSSSLPGLLIKYRLIANDQSFDQIIEQEANGYHRFMLDKNYERLSDSLQKLNAALSLPEEFYTTEVRWTDRLFAFSKNYFNFILDEPVPLFDPELLFSSLTGSIGNVKIMPMFGVRWHTNSTEIAILVETNTAIEFEAQLVHFGTEPRKMGVTFYNLENGDYHFLQDDQLPQNIRISDEERIIKFTLPPEKLSHLKITKRK